MFAKKVEKLEENGRPNGFKNYDKMETWALPESDFYDFGRILEEADFL